MSWALHGRGWKSATQSAPTARPAGSRTGNPAHAIRPADSLGRDIPPGRPAVASSMISSLAESITNWPNDRSIALGGPADVGAAVQIGPMELFPPAIVTDARGLASAIAASRAMRSNESGAPTRAEPACHEAVVAAADASTGAVRDDDETRASKVDGAERTTLPRWPILPLPRNAFIASDIRKRQGPGIQTTVWHTSAQAGGLLSYPQWPLGSGPGRSQAASMLL